MGFTTVFLIYLTFFRVAVIASGIVSIILGYKLFLKGVMGSSSAGIQGKATENGGHEGTDIEGGVGGFNITVKNATPGTCFALFGVIIIALNFWQGGPELTLKTIEDSGVLSQDDQNSSTITEFTMKSTGADSIISLTEKARQFERNGDRNNAIKAYKKALLLLGEPMNNLASLYLKEGRNHEALMLAGTAVNILPDIPNVMHTYAMALESNGEIKEAVKYLEKAVAMNPRYESDLRRLKN